MSLPVRPTEDAEFASGSNAQIIDPPAVKKQTGWIAELPPFQYFNWFFNTVWKWQIFFDRRVVNTELVTATGALAPDVSHCRRFHFDSTAGAQSLVLPAITSADNDLFFDIKKIDSTTNSVKVVGTVEGEVNPTIDYQFTGRSIYAFNGSWFWSR